MILIAVVSNEVNFERNIAFHCNQKVIKMVCNQIDRAINTVYIWSDGCVSQLRSQYVFLTLSFYPPDLKMFWDYGEAHHFKGPHDGIGGTIKRSIYNDVRSSKVTIKESKNLADYANEKLNLHVIYLDKKAVTESNVDDSVPVPSCLSVHHVERVTENLIDTYKNSNYEKFSKVAKAIEYKEDQEHSSTVSTETT